MVRDLAPGDDVAVGTALGLVSSVDETRSVLDPFESRGDRLTEAIEQAE